ncbi:hypothetical protein BC939DRAFT_482367 [Gamsiella multidivaricata]|uniref:uncharacterized protein n=1 Tax=Gamsiella multidivaricata TaxID=101098 RepID=UPI00221E881A|nr:uncharacterized protein BC939DRAFT_482367 [Gamsiella multidivaricata]KAI7816040.1 hypothetical protein BC939DRAFT_482367 [Gamsiella multidivaricata]
MALFNHVANKNPSSTTQSVLNGIRSEITTCSAKATFWGSAVCNQTRTVDKTHAGAGATGASTCLRLCSLLPRWSPLMEQVPTNNIEDVMSSRDIAVHVLGPDLGQACVVETSALLPKNDDSGSTTTAPGSEDADTEMSSSFEDTTPTPVPSAY